VSSSSGHRASPSWNPGSGVLSAVASAFAVPGRVPAPVAPIRWSSCRGPGHRGALCAGWSVDSPIHAWSASKSVTIPGPASSFGMAAWRDAGGALRLGMRPGDPRHAITDRPPAAHAKADLRWQTRSPPAFPSGGNTPAPTVQRADQGRIRPSSGVGTAPALYGTTKPERQLAPVAPGSRRCAATRRLP